MIPGTRSTGSVHSRDTARAFDLAEPREAAGGTAAQLLHRGPYREEPATLDRLHCFIRQQGGRPSAGQREIYFNDARRTAPDKLKTILRVTFSHP